MIIKGMANPRKFPNNPLKVANPATSHSGENDPIAMPSKMAIRIFGSKPSFSCSCCYHPQMLFSLIVHSKRTKSIGHGMNKLYHILDIIVIMQNMTAKHTHNRSDGRYTDMSTKCLERRNAYSGSSMCKVKPAPLISVGLASLNGFIYNLVTLAS